MGGYGPVVSRYGSILGYCGVRYGCWTLLYFVMSACDGWSAPDVTDHRYVHTGPHVGPDCNPVLAHCRAPHGPRGPGCKLSRNTPSPNGRAAGSSRMDGPTAHLPERAPRLRPPAIIRPVEGPFRPTGCVRELRARRTRARGTRAASGGCPKQK